MDAIGGHDKVGVHPAAIGEMEPALGLRGDRVRTEHNRAPRRDQGVVKRCQQMLAWRT